MIMIPFDKISLKLPLFSSNFLKENYGDSNRVRLQNFANLITNWNQFDARK